MSDGGGDGQEWGQGGVWGRESTEQLLRLRKETGSSGPQLLIPLVPVRPSPGQQEPVCLGESAGRARLLLGHSRAAVGRGKAIVCTCVCVRVRAHVDREGGR